MFNRWETRSKILAQSNRCVSPFLCPLRLDRPCHDLPYLDPPHLYILPSCAALLSSADAVEPRVADDIPVLFDILIPLFAVAEEFDSSGRPRFSSLPSIVYHASSSNSFEVAR